MSARSEQFDDKLTRVPAIRKESVEVIVVRTVERFYGAIPEDSVREAVNEIYELEKDNPMHYLPCIFSRQGNASEPRCFSLVFSQNVSSPVLTGRKIKGEEGIFINLALVDSLTREVIKNGPEAAAKVEILVLKGDSAGHEACNGKLEDFSNRIISKMKGKNSVLQGTTTLELKEGISSIDNLSFTHNACWTKNSKFCLGARAVNSFPGTIIEPAETESFDLKDNRVTTYAKKEVPSLDDKVWVLKHIGRGKTKDLNDESIDTVKDLLVVLNTNPQRLSEILKVGTKTWEEVTDNAKTCIIDDKAVHVYFDPDSQQKCGAVFDVIGQVKGSLKESQYFPTNMLSDVEEKDAQRLVKCAFDQWEKVSTYNDVNSLMEHFPLPLASKMTENPCQFITWDSPLFDTWEQADIASCNIFTSTNCIGESSHSGFAKQSLWGPIYSPPYYDGEFLHFMTFDDQPERPSPELKPKLSWFIICVSRWLVIGRRVGSLERNHVNKRQKTP